MEILMTLKRKQRIYVYKITNQQTFFWNFISLYPIGEFSWNCCSIKLQFPNSSILVLLSLRCLLMRSLKSRDVTCS